MQRSPIPTLFPYTTLFRSKSQVVVGAHVQRLGVSTTKLVGAVEVVRLPINEGYVSAGNAGGRTREAIVEAELEPADVEVIDRKSTRLNSSHPSISYAVFCL